MTFDGIDITIKMHVFMLMFRSVAMRNQILILCYQTSSLKLTSSAPIVKHGVPVTFLTNQACPSDISPSYILMSYKYVFIGGSKRVSTRENCHYWERESATEVQGKIYPVLHYDLQCIQGYRPWLIMIKSTKCLDLNQPTTVM